MILKIILNNKNEISKKNYKKIINLPEIVLFWF